MGLTEMVGDEPWTDPEFLKKEEERNAVPITLYIAGPITGIPEGNVPAFNEAERTLVNHGYEVKNPVRHGVSTDPDSTMEWADYMRRDIKDLMDCEGIALLDGWESSIGARVETDLAKVLGIPVFLVPTWVRRGKPLEQNHTAPQKECEVCNGTGFWWGG